MAQGFDVKLTTVRSQLQQVFAKTGTSRQAELVAVLLSHGYVNQKRGPSNLRRNLAVSAPATRSRCAPANDLSVAPSRT